MSDPHDGLDTLGSGPAPDPFSSEDLLLKQFVEHVHGVFWIATPDKSRILYVSPAYEEIWGRRVSALMEDPADFLAAIHPRDREYVSALLPLQAEGRYDVTYRIVRDGATRWIRDRAFPVRDHAGAVFRLVGVADDVTESYEAEASLRRAERSLRESEARYRRLSEAAFEGIAVHDRGIILDANQALAAMFGYTVGELIGRSAEQLAHPDSRDAIRSAIAMGSERPYRAWGIRSDGSRFPVELQGRSIRYADQSVRITAIRDLSDQHRIEEALREKESTLAASERVGQLGSWEWVPATEEVRWSEGLFRIYGLPPRDEPVTLDEFIGHIHPDDRDFVRAQIERISASQGPFCFEERIVRPDGEVRLLESHGTTIRTGDGGIRVVGICRDLTEQREAEEEARLRTRHLELVATASRAFEGAALSVRGVLDQVCRVLTETLGQVAVVRTLSADGERLDPVAVRAQEGQDTRRLRLLLAGTPHGAREGVAGWVLREGVPYCTPDISSAEARRLLKPEYRAYVDSTGIHAMLVAPLRGREAVIGTIGVARTDRRPYSESDLHFLEALADRAGLMIENARLLERAETALEAKSKFLAVASHELRTPLSVIVGYVDLALLGIPAAIPDELRPGFERVNEAAHVLGDQVDRVLQFSRLQLGEEPVHPQHFNVWTLVRRCVEEIRQEAGARGLRLSIDLPDAPDFVYSDPGRLREVLGAVLDNAHTYTERGSVRVTGESGDEEIVVRVSDSGIGIAPDDVERIFEPFWQAEAPLTRGREGLGLGLALAERTVRGLGGEIGIESELGRGTTVSIRLPRHAGWIAGQTADGGAAGAMR